MSVRVSELDQPASASSRLANLWPYAVGIPAGLLALLLGGLALRWTVYIMAAILTGLLFLVTSDTRRLFTRAFILSLQADLCIRFFYGKAGSTGIAIYLTAIIAAGLATQLFMTRPRGDLRIAGVLKKPIALFFITTLLSLVTTNERFVGITELVFEAQVFLVYWVALNSIRTEKQLEEYVTLLLVCLAMQSVIYFIQSATGMTFTMTGEIIHEGVVPRPGGTVSTNPAGFASFIIPLLFVAMARFITVGSRPTWGLGLLVSAGVCALVLTVTRASWSAFALGSVILIATARRRGVLRKRALPAFCMIAVGLFLAAWPMMATRLKSASVSDSYDERAELMRIATRVIAAHPLTGVGAGAYQHTYKKYVGDAHGWLYTVHNEYLLRTAETGIPGGIAFVLLIAASLLQALRLSRATSGPRTIWTLGLGWSAAILALCFEIYWDEWRGFTYNAVLWLMLGVTEAAERLNTAHAGVGDQGTGSTEMSEGAVGRPS